MYIPSPKIQDKNSTVAHYKYSDINERQIKSMTLRYGRERVFRRKNIELPYIYVSHSDSWIHMEEINSIV